MSPQGTLKPVVLQDLSRISLEELALVPSPATGTPGALTPPREFNLMFQTNVGAMAVRLTEIELAKHQETMIMIHDTYTKHELIVKIHHPTSFEILHQRWDHGD